MGVVVKVSEHYDTDLGIYFIERVGNRTAERSGSLAKPAALLLSASARGPVIDDDGDAAAAHQTNNTHLVAGLEFRKLGHYQTVIRDIEHTEQLGIIKQTHIHTTRIR